MFKLKMHVPKAENVDKVLGRIKLPNNKTFLPNPKTAAEYAKADSFIKLNNTPYIQPMRKGTDPIIPRDALHPYEPVKYFGPKPKENPKELLVAAGSPPPPPPGGDDGDKVDNLKDLLRDLNKNLNKNTAKTSYQEKTSNHLERYRDFEARCQELRNKLKIVNQQK